MAKFNDFVTKLKDTQTKKKPKHEESSEEEQTQQFEAKQETKRLSWMTKQVHFHIDSEKAYNVTKAADYGASVGTGKNFEEYLTKKNV